MNASLMTIREVKKPALHDAAFYPKKGDTNGLV